MKVGLAQINPCVGDLEGNVIRCEEAAARAADNGAELVVLPEMVVPGYPPRDILYDPSFVEAVGEATVDLAARLSGAPPVLVGTLTPSGRRPPGHPGLYNVAAVLEGGLVRTRVVKRLLPVYDVFYEPRWFVPGEESRPVAVAGRNVGVLICEDLWDEGYAVHPPAELVEAGADLLVAMLASPYRREVLENRLHQARRVTRPLVFVNLCGAQDELIFDGRSFVVDAAGEVVAMLSAFAEEVRVVDMDRVAPVHLPARDPEAELFDALVLGVRDFAAKNGLQRAVVGVSGGVDSAVVAVVAAAALGRENVTAVAIPSRFTDERSTICAVELARSLGVAFEVVPLEPLHAAAEHSLERVLDGGTTDENVQARLRAMILMSFVNRRGGVLLNTSNKTEMALGYTTLYGDMAGSLCPIGDLTKPEVVALATWISHQRTPIPRFILERPPSAELRPDQVDPFDYASVAPAVEQLVRSSRSDAALRRSEHKRWQAGVVLKVSEKAFGSGRLIPISRR